MKYILIMFLFVFSVNAQECTQVKDVSISESEITCNKPQRKKCSMRCIRKNQKTLKIYRCLKNCDIKTSCDPDSVEFANSIIGLS